MSGTLYNIVPFLNKLEEHKQELREIDPELYYLYLDFKDHLKTQGIYTHHDAEKNKLIMKLLSGDKDYI